MHSSIRRDTDTSTCRIVLCVYYYPLRNSVMTLLCTRIGWKQRSIHPLYKQRSIHTQTCYMYIHVSMYHKGMLTYQSISVSQSGLFTIPILHFNLVTIEYKMQGRGNICYYCCLLFGCPSLVSVHLMQVHVCQHLPTVKIPFPYYYACVVHEHRKERGSWRPPLASSVQQKNKQWTRVKAFSYVEVGITVPRRNKGSVCRQRQG